LAPVVSFTVETDGRLPSGQPLGEAIEQVDAETNEAPAYYMINCAHPTHFARVLDDAGAWRERIRGLRANASTKGHTELRRVGRGRSGPARGRLPRAQAFASEPERRRRLLRN
jgi:S-methylmethionine-dependent homocysteine/selenocysteine methylase